MLVGARSDIFFDIVSEVLTFFVKCLTKFSFDDEKRYYLIQICATFILSRNKNMKSKKLRILKI